MELNKGLQFNWENNFAIEVKTEGNEVIILANNEGLLSLAKHLLTLAQDEVPIGAHIHLDEYNSLEDGFIDLIIEKRIINIFLLKNAIDMVLSQVVPQRPGW